MLGRTVRRFIADLGYVVHTPRSVFGPDIQAYRQDEDWLPVVGANGWVIFCRDQHILDRDLELKAYLNAKVHMFLLPGQATREQIIDLIATNLAEICTLAAARRPNVYWLMRDSVVPFERRRAELTRQRRRSR